DGGRLHRLTGPGGLAAQHQHVPHRRDPEHGLDPLYAVGEPHRSPGHVSASVLDARGPAAGGAVRGATRWRSHPAAIGSPTGAGPALVRTSPRPVSGQGRAARPDQAGVRPRRRETKAPKKMMSAPMASQLSSTASRLSLAFQPSGKSCMTTPGYF